MADESSSGYFWNVQRYRGSRAVQRMSFTARGVYRELLDEQWEKRFVPSDLEAVVALIATTDIQAAEVRAAWPLVRPKFVTDERHPDRMFNVALERTRRQQRANLRKRAADARRAGLASAAKRRQQQLLPVNDRSTAVSRSSTDQNRLDKTRREKSTWQKAAEWRCTHEPRCSNRSTCDYLSKKPKAAAS